MRGVLAFLLAFALVPWGFATAASADPIFTKAYTGVSQPVDIEFAPDGSLYYIELMSGGLRRIAPGATTPDAQPIWVAKDLQTGGERGLMGMALDPDIATTHAIYVVYTSNTTGTPIDRLSKIVDGQETVLLDNIRAEIMHNSGRLLFMPDKTLLMSVGDATIDTIGRDASKHAHNVAEINGKVLHLNRDGTAVAGNPWGNMVWTKGHRNVYGLARNPDASIVIGTENGPDRGDEINILVAGKDYGWPTCAGPCAEDPACNACDASGFEGPVLSWTPTVGLTGAAWAGGSFFFTDFNLGRLHRSALLPNGTWSDDIIGRLGTRAIDVTVGADGLYLSSWDTIWRVSFRDAGVSADAPAVPTTLPAESTPPAVPLPPSAPSPATSTTPPSAPSDDTPPTVEKSGNAIPAPSVAWALVVIGGVAVMLVRRTR